MDMSEMQRYKYGFIYTEQHIACRYTYVYNIVCNKPAIYNTMMMIDDIYIHSNTVNDDDCDDDVYMGTYIDLYIFIFIKYEEKNSFLYLSVLVCVNVTDYLRDYRV